MEDRGEGFVVLGCPADDVAHQEPRSDEEIAEFCKANFGVSFPMFAKSNVVEDPVNPVFAKLGDELGEPSSTPPSTACSRAEDLCLA